MTFYIIAAVACLVLSAFFSGVEMAYSSANRIRLENLAEDGNRAAACAVKILDKFDNALSALLIGNNFVNIALSSLGSVIAITAFGEEYTWLATVIVTVSVIIFGETMPKIVAKKNANRVAVLASYIIRFLTIVFTPLVWLSVNIVHLLTAPFKGEKNDEDEQDAAVEELQSIIETAEDEDVLDEDRSELLQAALDFNDISAFEVMTARVDMEAIDIEDDWEDILETLKSVPYSRIPVYEGSIDNIIGVLYLNHFFKELVDKRFVNIRALLMEPCYVYKTVKLPAVLAQLKGAKRHLAIVTDEYGGVTGLITMEDVLEQIVGEIWDETDEIEDEVIEREDGVFELDGDMVMSDFLELIERDEESFETDSSTVGGWTLEVFGTFPKAGQHFVHENLEVTVLEMDGLRVEKVLVRVLHDEDDE
ncbi:MAG: HlyC/CorC family transporter [Oscillospiraceae bacterium]|nr:HlyC/CorC family transporter [Oscillospiraceae bacterium]